MAVPVFNLAPDLTVSRLCLGSTLFLCSCLLQSLVVFEFLILKFRILARNHDFRRAKHAATVLSSPRSSFPCRNQLLWLRWNVPSGSASRDSGEERGVSWPLDKGEQHSSRRRRFGHQGCSIGLFTLLVPNSFQYFQLACFWVFICEHCLIQVAGPSGQMAWIRDGPKSLDARNITEAIDSRLISSWFYFSLSTWYYAMLSNELCDGFLQFTAIADRLHWSLSDTLAWPVCM